VNRAPEKIPTPGISAHDLESIISRSAPEIEQLLLQPVLVTGGSGFVGRWLIETLVAASLKMAINAEIVSLNRVTTAWQGELVRRGLLQVVNADISKSFHLDQGFGYVFHCATPASAALNESNPAEMQRIIEQGAENIIQLFSETSTRVVNVSSGAVYGIQPADLQCFKEEWMYSSRRVLPNSAYHHAKVGAEERFNRALNHSSIEVVHARLFAFLAPLLPLDQHFAAGNFIRDAVNNSPIIISGDHRTVRTYMYGTDLVVWLIATAVLGRSGDAYNIGSPYETTIGELASQIARIAGSTAGVSFIGTPDLTLPAHRYVPCTTRTQRELGVTLDVRLEEAVERTLRWCRLTMQ
jgi:UDP-glucuronate decarboxylase